MNIKFMIKKQKLAANVLFYMSFSLALSASINTTAAETQLPNTALLGHEIPTTHLVYQEQAFKIYGDERSSLHREIDEVKSAAQVFKERFGEFGSLDVVIVESPVSLFHVESTKYTKHFLPFLSYSALSSFHGTTASFDDSDKNILSHEVCHKFMILLMEQEGLENVSSGTPRYGHTALPDWFDEVAAISCESDILKARRLRDFYESGNVETLYSLSEFLTMEHPSLKAMEKELSNLVNKAEMSANASGYAMEVMVIEENDTKPLLNNYYVQTLLFDKFIGAALGDDAMKQLVKLMSQGHSIEDWLMSELKLDNKEQVNKAFKLFVDEEYRKYKQLG